MGHSEVVGAQGAPYTGAGSPLGGQRTTPPRHKTQSSQHHHPGFCLRHRRHLQCHIMRIVEHIEGYARTKTVDAEAAEGRPRPVVEGHHLEAITDDRRVAQVPDGDFAAQGHIVFEDK